MSDSRDELHRFLSEEELKDCIVLVMANKQDLPNALSVAEITDQLGLDKIRGRTWSESLIVVYRGKGMGGGKVDGKMCIRHSVYSLFVSSNSRHLCYHW